MASADSTNNAYQPSGTAGVQPGSGSVSPTGASHTTVSTSTGSLPFTGLDIAALAAGGVVLLGAGVVLRRASAPARS